MCASGPASNEGRWHRGCLVLTRCGTFLVVPTEIRNPIHTNALSVCTCKPSCLCSLSSQHVFRRDARLRAVCLCERGQPVRGAITSTLPPTFSCKQAARPRSLHHHCPLPAAWSLTPWGRSTCPMTCTGAPRRSARCTISRLAAPRRACPLRSSGVRAWGAASHVLLAAHTMAFDVAPVNHRASPLACSLWHPEEVRRKGEPELWYHARGNRCVRCVCCVFLWRSALAFLVLLDN